MSSSSLSRKVSSALSEITLACDEIFYWQLPPCPTPKPPLYRAHLTSPLHAGIRFVIHPPGTPCDPEPSKSGAGRCFEKEDGNERH